MHPDLEQTLRQNIEQYNQLHSSGQLTKENVQSYRADCIDALAERMTKVDQKDDEFKECAFIVNALKNGWLVSDIDTLRTYYQSVQKLPKSNEKTEGESCLYVISSFKVEKLIDRMEMLNRVNMNMYTSKFTDQSLTDAYNAIRSHYYNRVIYPAEYPDDADFAHVAGKEDLTNGVSYSEISKDPVREANFFEAKKERRRTNEDYYIPEVDDPMNAENAERFESGWWHRNTGGITKKTSLAVKQSLGTDIYDEIYEMSRGSVSDRKVKLYHSLGTKYQKQGHDVLQMDFAGSGGETPIKKHKGRGGKIVLEKKTAEEIKTLYGTKVQKPRKPGKFFDFIWKREGSMKIPGKEPAKKVHYDIAGPSPTMLWGLPNFGEYSIENSRDNATFFGVEFLKERFDDWRLNGKEPKPIHIQLSGHSRGAVTAGQTAIKINEWVQKYCQRYPDQAANFKDFVHYDLVLRDPVPGFGTDATIGDCDLRKVPNVNATVFCSLGIQAPDDLYALQHVRGAKKLILNTMLHQMDTGDTDESQINLVGNGKEGHMVSYFDSETGEMHRGSGISELPDGVYIADEKYRLIRVTSYSQLKEMYNSTFDTTTPQRIRSRRIHKMVRDWFCENELEMSFPDERTRRAETAKANGIKEKIQGMKVKRLRSVQEELKKIDKLKADPTTSREAMIAANKNLIKVCREYMKNTTMPPKGISADKAGMVGDILSFTMRENNQLSKELNLVSANDPRAILDAKILAQKERLEQREGYLQNKQFAERKRLEQEKEIETIIKKTREICKDNITSLNQIGKWKKKNAKFKAILEEGSRLGPKTSIREMKDFLGRFSALSKKEDYESLRKAGAMAATKLNSISAGLGDPDVPIGVRIQNREENLAYLKNKEQELRRRNEAQANGREQNQAPQNQEPQNQAPQQGLNH
ncbi:MAG: hypothetical protein J5589_03020 [Firmicutes bacterium]|nr:hypothetical protein [Bacillota bacterium]